MHQSFTGSSRRHRQVNLSGRTTSNPWSTPSAQSASQHAVGTQNTLAHAHAERLQRGYERQKVTAARKIQKTWRGHSSRQRTKQAWREEWDHTEQQRLCEAHIQYDRVLEYGLSVEPYHPPELCTQQLRLLVMFLNVKDSLDRMRLLYFAGAMMSTIPNPALGWRPRQHKEVAFHLTRLGLLTATSLLARDENQPSLRVAILDFELMRHIGQLIPESLSGNASIYFKCIEEYANESSPSIKDETRSLLHSLVGHEQVQSTSRYKAFASFLASPALLQMRGALDVVSERISLFDLRLALIHDPHHDMEGRLYQLAYFIYIFDHQPLTETKEQDRVKTLSKLLGRTADEISKFTTNRPNSEVSSTPAFVVEQVSTLAQQISVLRAMSSAANPRDLAKYAIALLRAFPSKAFDIRKWIYQGSMNTLTTNISATQYFWRAARNTNVFRGIYENSANVLSLLRQPTAEHNQIGRSGPSKADEEIWRDDWQIILLFFELYTFVLKPMDDEEFFSLAEQNGFNSSEPSPSTRGALPLTDVAVMTTFLKNMAFTLYWNAADLADSNSFEHAGGLSAYFGIHPIESKRVSTHGSQVQCLAGMDGMSQQYLKGLVTGLLRMVHERDSRRKFLPKDHWLMTKHVDMAGFISAVVAEEEKRHELGDDMDEEDPWSDILDAENDLHAIPIDQPHLNFARPGRSSQLKVMEDIDRRRELARKKRQLESLAPRLEILRNLPFFIPFETRVQIFREFVKQDQLRRREGHLDPDNWRMHTAMGSRANGFPNMQAAHDRLAAHRAEVHRDSIFEDAFDSFYGIGEGLKEPIQISFIDRFGNPEAGIDGGGVTKEFLTSITNEAFDPKSEMALFAENEQHEIYPSPTIFESTIEILRRVGIRHGTEDFQQNIRHFWQQFEFLGRIMGKCIYEGILVDINFAGFFLLKWALTGGTTAASNETAYRASINDVKDFDQALYQGLLALKNYNGDVENDFGLNFSVTDSMHIETDSGPTTYTVTNDLVKNGSNIAVTRANRDAYISAIARYRLQVQPKFVTDAFLQGLSQIIQPMWLAMFNQKELQTLVGGENSELDIADLRRNTQYNGLYQIGDDGLEHPTIELFWKVLKDLSDENRRKILKFVTSTPRAPLLGFSNLTPPFTIHSTSASEGLDRLPSTSTCVNLLKLPNYRDEKTMREKLLYAANSGAGFDLS